MFEHVAHDLKLKGRTILALQKAVVDTFRAADWIEVGYKTGNDSYIKRHDRLLRSLQWGDDDYGACAFQALEKILSGDIENLASFFEKEGIVEWFGDHEPALLREIGLESKRLAPQFSSPKLSTRDVVERALRDTEALMEASGAISAIDRVHTALHGYLYSQCENAGIEIGENAKITDLYKALRVSHRNLQDLGPWPEDIDRVLKSFASVLDTLNHLRNNASVAHPNERLLYEAEAELVINASRTILHYLDMKLHSFERRTR